jgi:heterodisulfide reductase subunit A-like polyferredoxin
MMTTIGILGTGRMGVRLARMFAENGQTVILGTIERMTLLSGELGQRYGYFPRMNYKLLGETWTPGQSDRLASPVTLDTRIARICID